MIPNHLGSHSEKSQECVYIYDFDLYLPQARGHLKKFIAHRQNQSSFRPAWERTSINLNQTQKCKNQWRGTEVIWWRANMLRMWLGDSECGSECDLLRKSQGLWLDWVGGRSKGELESISVYPVFAIRLLFFRLCTDMG